MEKSSIFSQNSFPVKRSKLRVAHPTVKVLLLFAPSDTCLKHRCGLDVFMIQYIAQKLKLELMYYLVFDFFDLV